MAHLKKLRVFASLSWTTEAPNRYLMSAAHLQWPETLAGLFPALPRSSALVFQDFTICMTDPCGRLKFFV